MADLQNKKSDCLSELVRLAPIAIAIVRDVTELQSYVNDNGFASSQPNAITDADCKGENQHLTAALFNSAITAIANINLSANQKTIMRQVSKEVLPTNS